MNKDLSVEVCKECPLKIVCEDDATVMCNAYRLIMRLRGEEFHDG